MKKIFYSIFIPFFVLFLFISCEKKEEESAENKINNEKLLSFTKKYLDFYDEEDNIFLILSFENKDFLEEELWKEIPQFEIQEAEKTEKKAENYTLIIPLKDGYTYEIRKNVANSDEFKTLFSKALKRRESLIVKNWASLYENELIVKKEDSEEESYNFNYYSYDDVPLFINVFCKNSEEIDEEISQNILSREEKNMKTYINGKVDLNQDNVEEEISFISQVPKEDIGTDSNSETEAKLVINNKTFEFIDLLSLAGIEEGDLYWMLPIIDMEILDMDKKDNYQELVFVIEGSRYAPSLGIFFHYDKNNLKYLGAINLPWTDNFTTCVDKKSSALKIKEWNNSLGFSSFQEKLYFIQEGKLKEQENISDIRIFDRKVVGIVKENIEVYKGKDSDELLFTAEEGDNLLFVSSNFKSWLKVKSFNTGKIGYIHFQMKESEYGEELYFYKQEDLDGMTFQDIFDNLPFNE